MKSFDLFGSVDVSFVFDGDDESRGVHGRRIFDADCFWQETDFHFHSSGGGHSMAEGIGVFGDCTRNHRHGDESDLLRTVDEVAVLDAGNGFDFDYCCGAGAFDHVCHHKTKTVAVCD